MRDVPVMYGAKSAQTIIMEGFTGLVFGLDAASALVVNYGKESEDVDLPIHRGGHLPRRSSVCRRLERRFSGALETLVRSKNESR